MPSPSTSIGRSASCDPNTCKRPSSLLLPPFTFVLASCSRNTSSTHPILILTSPTCTVPDVMFGATRDLRSFCDTVFVAGLARSRIVAQTRCNVTHSARSDISVCSLKSRRLGAPSVTIPASSTEQSAICHHRVHNATFVVSIKKAQVHAAFINTK